MSTARKTKAQTAEPSLRERVKAARASATRLSRRGSQAEASPDPILAAIERHRSAATAFRENVDYVVDKVSAKSGGNLGGRDPAAEAVWQAADLAQIEAWNALFDTQPTTSGGLVALLRHVGEYAENMLDTGGTYTAASIFDGLADRVAALSGQLHGSRHCQASVIAAKLGSLTAEWFEADAEGGASNSRKMALHEQIQTLSEAISYTRAALPAGMMGQLVVTFSAVDTVLNGRADLREAGARRAERCLLSIAAALSALSGIDREGYGASYMMSGQIDWMACLSPEAA